jgi:signal transduction histidine kinase
VNEVRTPSAAADEAPLDADAAIRAAASLLAELRDGHRRLEARAEHVEAELSRTNTELAHKVTELEHVKGRLEALLAAIPTGVIVYDSAGRIERVNAAAAAIVGRSPDHLVGRTAAPALVGAVPATTAVLGRRVATLCDDGRTRALVHRHSSVVGPEGDLMGAVEVLDDQTELAEAEDRMRRLDRAAALGTMVGGVAHEVRNPLHAIAGFADLLRREVPKDSRAAKHAERIRAGVQDLEAIVASMLGIAGHGRLALEHTPLRPVVDAAVRAALAARTARGAEERATPTPSVPRYEVDVRCDEQHATFDPIELRQALRNLVANALDAQPHGGRVLVDVRLDGTELVIAVDDAGPACRTTSASTSPIRSSRPAPMARASASRSWLVSPSCHRGSLELAPGPGPLGGASFRLRLPFDPAPTNTERRQGATNDPRSPSAR